jgi:hypothetical protein
MTPHAEIIAGFAKPIAALSVAGVTYLAETVTPDIPGVPTWVTSLGLPVAFLVAVIYALVAIHKALRESEKGRREDWQTYAAKLEAISERGNETRERLIRATDNQTVEFAKLADHLKTRPCQRD